MCGVHAPVATEQASAPAARPPFPVPPRAAGDERLAAMVARGSEAAFAELFRRYHQLLYRYCRSLVRSDHDAQDALQNTFTNALLALRAGRRDAPMRPWLLRIAHNESISLLRKRPLDSGALSRARVDAHDS